MTSYRVNAVNMLLEIGRCVKHDLRVFLLEQLGQQIGIEKGDVHSDHDGRVRSARVRMTSSNSLVS